MRTDVFSLPQITEEEMVKNNQKIFKKLAPIIPRKAWTDRAPIKVQVESDFEVTVLKDIAMRPFLGVAKRCETITLPTGKGLNIDQGMVIFQNLEKDGYIRPLDLRLSLRGRPTKFYLLVQKGRIKAHLSPETDAGRGGRKPEHRFAQKFLSVKLQNENFSTNVEGELMGKKVDVEIISFKDGAKFAVEVAMSTEKIEYKQASEDLSAGYDRVIIVCLDKKSLKRVEKGFTDNIEQPDPRITICLLWEIIQCPLQEIYENKELVYNRSTGSKL